MPPWSGRVPTCRVLRWRGRRDARVRTGGATVCGVELQHEALGDEARPGRYVDVDLARPQEVLPCNAKRGLHSQTHAYLYIYTVDTHTCVADIKTIQLKILSGHNQEIARRQSEGRVNRSCQKQWRLANSKAGGEGRRSQLRRRGTQTNI